MKVLVPLADGFEEIEAVTIIDVLRRAEIIVTTAYLDKNPVKGSHGIQIMADTDIRTAESSDFNAIVLPGGMPGSENLKNNEDVKNNIIKINKDGGIVAAICAAPIVLGNIGILKNRNAVCYPGFEKELKGASVLENPVVIDDNIITGSGAGKALLFSLEIVKKLKGEDIMKNLKEQMLVD